MKMKLMALFIAIFPFLTLNSRADQPRSDNEFMETKIVDGFFMGVYDEFGHTNTSPDNRHFFPFGHRTFPFGQLT